MQLHTFHQLKKAKFMVLKFLFLYYAYTLHFFNRAESLRACSLYTMCPMSCVTCHMSRVMCHVSLVICHMFFFQ